MYSDYEYKDVVERIKAKYASKIVLEDREIRADVYRLCELIEALIKELKDV